jgi:hypothetical protein
MMGQVCHILVSLVPSHAAFCARLSTCKYPFVLSMQVFVGLCLGAVGAETTYPCRGSRSSYSFCACSAAFIPSHYEGCGSLSWEWERKGRHYQTTRYGHIKRAECFPEGGEQVRGGVGCLPMMKRA